MIEMIEIVRMSKKKTNTHTHTHKHIHTHTLRDITVERVCSMDEDI